MTGFNIEKSIVFMIFSCLLFSLGLADRNGNSIRIEVKNLDVSAWEPVTIARVKIKALWRPRGFQHKRCQITVAIRMPVMLCYHLFTPA